MWAIAAPGGTVIKANNPDDKIVKTLKSEYPGSQIFKSLKPCVNEVNKLLFAATVIPGDLIDVEQPVLDDQGVQLMDEDGNLVFAKVQTQGPSKTIPCQNTAAIENNALIVKNESGETIATFQLELIHD